MDTRLHQKHFYSWFVKTDHIRKKLTPKNNFQSVSFLYWLKKYHLKSFNYLKSQARYQNFSYKTLHSSDRKNYVSKNYPLDASEQLSETQKPQTVEHQSTLV